MRQRITLLILTLLCCPLVLIGQIDDGIIQQRQFEENKSLHFIGNGEQAGMIIYAEKVEKRVEVYVESVDKDLKAQKHATYTIPKYYELISSGTVGDQVMMFYCAKRDEKLIIQLVDKKTLNVRSISSSYQSERDCLETFAVGSQVYIRLKNGEVQYFKRIDTTTGETEDIRLLMPRNQEAKFVKTYTTGKGTEKEFHIQYLFNEEGKNSFWVYRYGQKGELLKNKPLRVVFSDKKEITDLTLSKIQGKGEFVMTGTTIHAGGVYLDPLYGSDGFFTAVIDEESNHNNLQFHNYLKTEELVDALSDDKGIMKKVSKMSNSTKEKYEDFHTFNASYEQNDKHYSVIEFFKSVQMPSTYSHPVGPMSVSFHRVLFKPIRMLVIAMNSKGEILWKKVLPVNGETARFGGQVQVVGNCIDQVMFANAKTGKVHYKLIKEGNESEEMELVKGTITVKEPAAWNEKMAGKTGQAFYWYKDYWVFVGELTITLVQE